MSETRIPIRCLPNLGGDVGAPFDKGDAMILSVAPGRVLAGRWVYPFWKSSLVRNFDFTWTQITVRTVLAETLKRTCSN